MTEYNAMFNVETAHSALPATFPLSWHSSGLVFVLDFFIFNQVFLLTVVFIKTMGVVK